jgi:HD-GYP domain-containing protein (c-di-GMP phosphodiesterase class II)
LRAELDAIVDEVDVSPEERIALVQAAAMTEIESTFRLIQCDRYVSIARRLGKQIARLADDYDLEARRLFELLSHHEQKFSRVTNVAAYCAHLAKRMGIQGGADLEEITVGAMLYDVGDRFIPAEVLNKNGPLAPHEWKIVEQHPRTGYLNLLEFDGVTEAQRLMAYQHHERANGRGYPVRLTGDEIHPWAKMAAVVDVFDAATGSRPYRKALDVHEALEILQKNAGTLFDEEIVECWTTAMA